LEQEVTLTGNSSGNEDAYEDEDDASSEGIPDEDIDFSLTYALSVISSLLVLVYIFADLSFNRHTFIATVEGQASVMKGDSLILLDDTNSYWWLVKVLKTEEVGYIPAENIETPFERLARLNKFRNVEVGRGFGSF
jgi:hypothetical protein